jgi:hypothetical protein
MFSKMTAELSSLLPPIFDCLAAPKDFAQADADACARASTSVMQCCRPAACLDCGTPVEFFSSLAIRFLLSVMPET